MKLLPKFIGPYLILEANPESSTYQLDLPEMLQKQHIHDRFHVSKLRPYIANDEVHFLGRDKVEPYDFGEPDEEAMVKEIDNHCWVKGKPEFHVVWEDRDEGWSPYWNVEENAVLDDYLALKGVDELNQLPRQNTRRGRGRTHKH